LEELQQLFPSIPLVAEEDSACLRSLNAEESNGNALVESISSFVSDRVSNNVSPLSHDDVLRAIDRGGKDAVSFNSNPATYWVCCESFIVIICPDLQKLVAYSKFAVLFCRCLTRLMVLRVS
jgi:hypothetical protein